MKTFDAHDHVKKALDNITNETDLRKSIRALALAGVELSRAGWKAEKEQFDADHAKAMATCDALEAQVDAAVTATLANTGSK